MAVTSKQPNLVEFEDKKNLSNMNLKKKTKVGASRQRIERFFPTNLLMHSGKKNL